MNLNLCVKAREKKGGVYVDEPQRLRVKTMEVVNCPYCGHIVTSNLCLICKYGASELTMGEDFGVYVECRWEKK